MILPIKDYVQKSIHNMARNGIYLGVTNQTLHRLTEKMPLNSFTKTLIEYSETFPIIEWKSDFQNIIDEPLLVGIIGSHLRMVSFRFEVTKPLFTKYMGEPTQTWLNFISLLQERKSQIEIRIILSIDKNTVYSLELLHQFIAMQESIFPIPVLFEFEHKSWKNPTSMKIYRETHLSIIHRDIPHLTGFQFSIPTFSRKENYMRLLGRNQINWFSKESTLRYCYDYQRNELSSIANTVRELHKDINKTFVIAGNTPPENALSNILELSNILSKEK